MDMRAQRYWMAGTMAWLFVLFNIERIYEPINLASFVYLLASVAGIVLILSRRARHLPLYWSIAVALLGLVVMKVWLDYRIGLDNLPLTLAEGFAVGVTMYLSARVGRTSDLMREELLQLLMMSRGRAVPDFAAVEPLVQREISRARRFERPVTLVKLRVDEESQANALSSVLRKLEQELVACFTEGCVAELLQSQTKASDLLALENGKFLLLLPETEPADAQTMVARVVQSCFLSLGLKLHAEVIGFPRDELTLHGMLERSMGHAQAIPQPAAT